MSDLLHLILNSRAGFSPVADTNTDAAQSPEPEPAKPVSTSLLHLLRKSSPAEPKPDAPSPTNTTTNTSATIAVAAPESSLSSAPVSNNKPTTVPPTAFVLGQNGRPMKPQQQQQGPFASVAPRKPDVKRNQKVMQHVADNEDDGDNDESIEPGIAISSATSRITADDIDACFASRGSDFELRISQVAKYPADLQSNIGALIAVNEQFICYPVTGKHIRCIHRQTGSRALLKAHKANIQDLQFAASAAHQDILASVDQTGRLVVWQLDGQSPEKVQFEIRADCADRQYSRIAWHPQELKLALTRSSSVDFMTLADEGQAEQRTQCHLFCEEVASVSWSSSGSHVVTSSADGVVFVINVSSCEFVCQQKFASTLTTALWLRQPHAEAAENLIVTFSRAAAASDDQDAATTTLRLFTFNSAQLRCVSVLEIDQGANVDVTQVCADPSGAFVAVAFVSQGSKSGFHIVHVRRDPSRIDYLAPFTTSHPAVSFCLRDSDDSQQDALQLFMFSTKAIKQYHINADQCYAEQAQEQQADESDVFLPNWSSTEAGDAIDAQLANLSLDQEAIDHFDESQVDDDDASSAQPSGVASDSEPAVKIEQVSLQSSSSASSSSSSASSSEDESSDSAESDGHGSRRSVSSRQSSASRLMSPSDFQVPSTPKTPPPGPDFQNADKLKPVKSPFRSKHKDKKGADKEPSKFDLSGRGPHKHRSPMPLDSAVDSPQVKKQKPDPEQQQQQQQHHHQTTPVAKSAAPRPRNVSMHAQASEQSSSESPESAAAQHNGDSKAHDEQASPIVIHDGQQSRAVSGAPILHPAANAAIASPSSSSSSSSRPVRAHQNLQHPMPRSVAQPGRPAPARPVASSSNVVGGGVDIHMLRKLQSESNAVLVKHLDARMHHHNQAMHAYINQQLTAVDRASHERVTRLSKGIGETLQRVVPAQLEAILRQELQKNLLPAIGKWMTQSLAKVVQKVIVPSMEKAINHGVRKQLNTVVYGSSDPAATDEPSKLAEDVARAVTKPVQQEFRACFEQSLIPALQSTSAQMFKQMHETLQDGLKANNSDSKSLDRLVNQQQKTQNKHLQQLNSIRDNVVNVSSAVTNLTESLSAVASRVDGLDARLSKKDQSFANAIKEAAEQGASQAASATMQVSERAVERAVAIAQQAASSLSSAPSMRGHPAGSVAGSMASVASRAVDVARFKAEITDLLDNNHVNEAFVKALSSKSVTVVWWLCNILDCEKLFEMEPAVLEAPVVLSLCQQLAHHLNPPPEHEPGLREQARDFPMSARLDWLKEAISSFDMSSAVLSQHAPDVLPQVIHNLDVQTQGSPRKTLRKVRDVKLIAKDLLAENRRGGGAEPWFLPDSRSQSFATPPFGSRGKPAYTPPKSAFRM